MFSGIHRKRQSNLRSSAVFGSVYSFRLTSSEAEEKTLPQPGSTHCPFLDHELCCKEQCTVQAHGSGQKQHLIHRLWCKYFPKTLSEKWNDCFITGLHASSGYFICGIDNTVNWIFSLLIQMFSEIESKWSYTWVSSTLICSPAFLWGVHTSTFPGEQRIWC